MHKLLSPICLLLALTMLIVGFAVIGFGAPESSVQLHDARASGDEAFTDALEQDLQRRQLGRRVLIGLLFGGSILMAFTAFQCMRPSTS